MHKPVLSAFRHRRSVRVPGLRSQRWRLILRSPVRAYVASGSMRIRTNESSVFSGLIRRESVLAGLHEINDGRGIAALPRSLGVFPWFVQRIERKVG